MDRRQPADHRPVFHHNMPGQSRHVGHDDVVPDRDVMGNVTVGENMVVLTNRASPRRPPVK